MARVKKLLLYPTRWVWETITDAGKLTLLLVAMVLIGVNASEHLHHLHHHLLETLTPVISIGGATVVASMSLEKLAERLMHLFFVKVGCDLKRTLAVGELSSWRRALLPFVAAIGGAVPGQYFSLSFCRHKKVYFVFAIGNEIPL